MGTYARVPGGIKMNKKGLSVSVYRDADGSDCTLGGVTSKYKSFVLLSQDENAEGQVFEPSEKSPALIIRERGGYVWAEPVDKPTGRIGMMGGNFVYSSDSRYRRGVSQGPIPVHDRFETLEQCEAFSK
jgi:hypothetical protein